VGIKERATGREKRQVILGTGTLLRDFNIQENQQEKGGGAWQVVRRFCEKKRLTRCEGGIIPRNIRARSPSARKGVKKKGERG